MRGLDQQRARIGHARTAGIGQQSGIRTGQQRRQPVPGIDAFAAARQGAQLHLLQRPFQADPAQPAPGGLGRFDEEVTQPCHLLAVGFQQPGRTVLGLLQRGGDQQQPAAPGG